MAEKENSHATTIGADWFGDRSSVVFAQFTGLAPLAMASPDRRRSLGWTRCGHGGCVEPILASKLSVEYPVFGDLRAAAMQAVPAEEQQNDEGVTCHSPYSNRPL